MKILYYGINYAPELTGIGKYSGEMIEYLAQQGHEVTVITAPPYYPEWKVTKPYSSWLYKKEKSGGTKIIRCPLFVPTKPRTITRLLHLASFALTSLIPLFGQLFKKHDIIICVEPTLFCTPATLAFSKLSGAKCWLHIQDFEVDAMFEVNLGSKPSRLKSLATSIESWLLKHFDRVSSISQKMLQKAIDKGVTPEKAVFFPNWSNIDQITPSPDDQTFRKLWGFKQTDFIVLYSGNIGKKQGLENLVKAAMHFAKNEQIQFVIAGEGAAAESLKNQANWLPNIHFKPLQPLEQLNALLALGDLHMVIQKSGAADLVLPSKLTNILAAGKDSIITAEPHTELGILCEQFPGIARCIEPESVSTLITAIEAEFAKHKSREAINVVAREYAENFLDQKKVLGNFEAHLNSLANPENS